MPKSVKTMPKDRPAWLKQPCKDEYRATARTKVGSFLTKCQREGIATNEPMPVLQKFLHYIGQKHSRFQNLPMKHISTSDATISTLYDILRKTINARKQKPKTASQKHDDDSDEGPEDPHDSWMKKHPDTKDQVGRQSGEPTPGRPAGKAQAKAKKEVSEDKMDSDEDLDDDGQGLSSFSASVDQHQELKDALVAVVDDLTDNQRLMYTSKTYKTDDLEVKLQVTRVAVEKN